MTVTEAVRERAERIAELVAVVAKERLDNLHPSDWVSYESYGDYRTTLASVEARVDEVDGGVAVVVWPRMRPDGGYWTNIASEVVDSAADRQDTEAGADGFTHQYGHIEQAHGSHEARLVLPGRLPCAECGATPDQECLVPNCQGSWV